MENTEFLNDYNSLSKEEFLKKYITLSHNVYYRTKVTGDNDKKYIEIDKNNFYELKCSWIFDKDGNKYPYYEFDKLEINAINLKKINENITAEQMVYTLYKLYDDEAIKEYILEAVDKAINFDNEGETTSRKYPFIKNDSNLDFRAIKLDGLTKWNMALKEWRADKATAIVNPELSLEENLNILHSNPDFEKITKKTLENYCSYNGITLKSDKQINDEKLIQLIIDNPTLSDRKLSELAKERGIKGSKSTIANKRKEIY